MHAAEAQRVATQAPGAEKESASLRATRPLAIALAGLMLYVGLFDGYLRLRTGSDATTLIRDLFLYSIAGIALLSVASRGESLRVPPLTGWVVAFVAVVLVQLLNPSNPSLSLAFAGVRPHLEWVPLFFLAYATMRSAGRLRVFLVLLVVIAAVNGVVGYVQFNLSPDQLASWGPGYSARIHGTGDVAARVFYDTSGTAHTRPFGLGSDLGFGGLLGLLAAPATLALLALPRPRWMRVGAVLLAPAIVVAVTTSQGRLAVVGTVLALVAFVVLAAAAREMLRTVGALVLVGVATLAVVGLLSGSASFGAFDRYANITPGRLFQTTIDYRRDAFSQVPRDLVEDPFGAGLGRVGPAGALGEQGRSSQLNAESEVTYLLVELGVLGLLVMFAFQFRLLLLCIGIRRVAGSEVRILLAALAAPLFALFIASGVGVTTATAPTAPYFWFTAGTLAYWLKGSLAAPAPRAIPPARRSRRRAAQASTG